MSGLPLLAVEPPQHRQTEVTVRAHRHRHGDAQDDPVEAEAEGLVLLGREHRVEEDAAEGHLGATLVAKRIVDGYPNDATGDQVSEDQGGQDNAQVVPLPDGGTEYGVGGVVVAPSGPTRGLPDPADSVRAQADNPASDENLKGAEDAGVKAVAKRLYQCSQRGDKLIHRADLHAVSDPWVPQYRSG